MQSEIYRFKLVLLDGQKVSIKQFKNKVILIVNTASKCGYTYQYKGLEELYRKYQDKSFVVLGFPCDQFGKQEPGNSQEIHSFCSENYDVTFPMSQKIKVNGKDADPLYKYLKKKLKGVLTDSIKWNFTKFLVGSDGKPYKRFSSKIAPHNLESHIKKLLDEKN